MKPDCPNCQAGFCYHIDENSQLAELEVEEATDYYADNPTAEELQEEFNAWLAKYGPHEYLETSEENLEKVKAINTRLVWTDHGTCEDPKVTNGFYEFTGGNCGCWEGYGWYVMTKPWDGPDDYFESVQVGAYLPCTVCNRSGEEEEYDEECSECEGEGYVNYFFD